MGAPSLRQLPFLDQIEAIDDAIRDGRGRELIEPLAGFRDHQPLAHAVAALVARDEIDPAFARDVALRLLGLPDPGLRRVLGAVGAHTGALSEALAEAVEALAVDRIAAISLVDRWLKNAAPTLHAAAVERAVDRCRRALDAGAASDVSDPVLVRVPGARYGELAERARGVGIETAWQERLAHFARAVIEALEAQPKSLSQANAEDLLSRQVYTDPGHFLIELLQNADDAGAHEFVVEVDDDRVTVSHDGAPFDARDVVGVLSIGQTTKSKDQIGMFGVGFKSVYEICERPQVYSGPFAFEIADVSIPRQLAAHPAATEGRTVIVLPLRGSDDPDRHADRLYERVAALPAEVVLTLNSVSRIAARRGERRRSVHREVRDRHRVALVEDGVARDYAIDLATPGYPGERDNHRASTTPVLVGVPLARDGSPGAMTGPTIYSHLPTGERSGLRFLVHAHFDVPLDRERLDLSSEWNRWALRQAAPGLARIIARLAEQTPSAIAVVPLPDELADDAYRAIAVGIADELADVAVLQGAGGERLAPSGALTITQLALARALAGIEVVEGRRPLLPLPPRETAIVHMLGARPLEPRDVIAAIARHAAAEPGAPMSMPWTWDGLAEIAAALADEPDADLAPLRDRAWLPDRSGNARRPGDVLIATGVLGELLAPLRPLVAEGMTADGVRLLVRVGVREARAADLVAELADPAQARALLAANAGAAVSYLAAAAPAELVDVGAAHLVPVDPGGFARVGQSWLAGDDPAGQLARSLTHAPPLCTAAFERAHCRDLERLGVRRLDLSALIALCGEGKLSVTTGEAAQFHAAIAAVADEVGPALAGRLARIAVFPDDAGDMRPLLGAADVVVHIPEDDDVRALRAGPWLRADIAALPHVRRLGAEPVGAEVIAGDLVANASGGAAPREVFAYLTARADRLSAPRRDELAAAPIWADQLGRVHPLAELRRPSAIASIAELYAHWPRAATIAPGDEPGSPLALARALGLDHQVVAPRFDTVIEDLVATRWSTAGGLFRGGDDAIDLDQRPVLAEAIAAVLCEAAGELPRPRLAAALEAPVFRASDGTRMRIGHWSSPSPQRCHRASIVLRAALAAGRYPLLDVAEDRALAPFLDAAGVDAATVVDLVRAVDADIALDPGVASRVRTALVAERDALGAADSNTRERVSALALWPTTRSELVAATAAIRVASLAALLPGSAAGWVEHDPWGTLLAATADSDADALAGLVRFRDPVAALADALITLARPGEPLAAQPPVLADAERIAELAAAFLDAGRDPFVLPVAVDADGRLVADRLLCAEPIEAALAEGLPLRANIGHPAWVAALAGRRPGALGRLTHRQVIAALATVSATASQPADHLCLATPARRALLYQWLLAHAATIAADEQARGALGSAAIIVSAQGMLRTPRELLFDPALPDLGIDWNAAAEVPEPLVTWLRHTFRPRSRQLAPIVDHLLEAGDRAIAGRDSSTLCELLDHLGRVLGADRHEDVAEVARRFQLRKRLKVETDSGEFARPRRLLALDAADTDLLARFAVTLPPRVSPRYRDRPGILRLCHAAGAEAELDDAALDRLLHGEGLRAGADGAIALACYVASSASRSPERRTRLQLAERAWIPDRSGSWRHARDLYRPDQDTTAIIGDADAMFPHPELVHRVPDVAAWAGFRGSETAALADVARHVVARRRQGQDVPDAVLRWLEDGLDQRRLEPGAVRDALTDWAFLVDDTGQHRRADHLVIEGARRLFADRRGDFAQGTRLPRLCAALRIPRQPGKREVTSFLAEIARDIELGSDLLALDPAVAERLPRCLSALVDAGGRGPPVLPILCEIAGGGFEVALLPFAAGSVGFAGDRRLAPVIDDGGDRGAWVAYLRAYGVEPPEPPEPRDRAAELVPTPPRSVPAALPVDREHQPRRGLFDRIAGWLRDSDKDDAEDRDTDTDTDTETQHRDDTRDREKQRRDETRDRKPRHRDGDRGDPPRSSPRGGTDDRDGDGDDGVDQRAWFRPDRKLGPQLRANPRWLADRRRAAAFGLAHAPRLLPVPYLYAPAAIFGAFNRRRQSFEPLDAPAVWRSGGDVAGKLSLRGKLPAGAAILPLPLCARVLSVDARTPIRTLAGDGGAAVVVCDDDAVITAVLELLAPDDLASSQRAGRPPHVLLEPTTEDDELPDEVHAAIEHLRDRSPFDAVMQARDFVRERYAYDPSYLEDPAIAAWLVQRSRGRANQHLAALHAGRDARHLGRGVCYELNVLVCEILRRAGIAAAVATGWTFDRGFVDEPDHLWAMALVDTEAGMRWLPVDASTTRTGRPLHAGHRPPGPWTAEARAAEPAPAPRWAEPAPSPRSPRRTTPPLTELLRVARYLEQATGRHLGTRDELLAACRELLADPVRSAALAELLSTPGKP